MPFGFRHALVREALVAELLPPELADLSARAADAIESRFPGLPGEWCERVAQLRETEGDRTAAAGHLQEAAQRAVGRGALGSAIDLLEHARSLTTTDRWHTIGIDRQLIGVLSLAGRVDRLREIGEAASAFIDEKRRVLPGITLARGEIHLLIARAMAADSAEADVEGHLAQARDYLEQTGEQRVWAGLKSFEAQRALARGDLNEARSKAAEALAIAADLRLDEAIGEALSVRGTAEFLAGNAETALDLFDQARRDARRPIQRLRASLDLGWAHAVIDGSIETLQEVQELASQSGALEYGMRAELEIAETLIHLFDLDAAATMLRGSVETSRRYRLPQLPEALALDALRLALAGDSPAAASLAGGVAPTGGRAGLMHAVIALLDEDVEGAREALQQARFGITSALSVLLATARGEPLHQIHASGAAANGLLAHASAIDAQSAGRFTVADASLVRFPWWRHIARRLSAEAALDAGWGDPAAWLPETLAFFEVAGHDRNVQACRALLRRSGAPVPRKGRGDASVPATLRAQGVTSREMDVLRLLAEGLGNRAIAGRLFLSHRTVETHVASLMRKLEASSRGELAARAGEA
jgi:DNA-binding CsgD family transcriptional regulator/tetratricopeptide (TPR) repeat protein